MLNRISTGASVNTSGTNCWAEQYGYDPWGNLLSMGALAGYTGCALPDNLSVSVTTANQISGYTYDAAGNLDTIPGTGGATYTYNAENQLTTTTAGVNYIYDGDGQRVEKSNGTLYWYGMGGEVLEETGLTGGLMNDYVFFGGSRVARRDAAGDVLAYFEDHLGSSREMQKIVAGASTATLVYDADFRPFGHERAFTESVAPMYKFTGKERDGESGLDNFGARYNSSNLGRFTSVDPSSVTGDLVDSESPQSWNMYSYVLNNPLSAVDPDGLDYYLIGGDQCGQNGVTCDKEGYVTNSDGNRVVITDQQISGSIGVAQQDANGNLFITTSQGTFQGQFFDPNPQTTYVYGGFDQASMLSYDVDQLTTVQSLSEVGRNGVLGAMAFDGTLGLASAVKDLAEVGATSAAEAASATPGEVTELPAGLRAPPVFFDHRFQHVLVQAEIGHQLLQPLVLIFQLPQTLRLAHAHPAILRLPGVDGVLRHAQFPAHVGGAASRFHLLQRPDHLHFAVLPLRHVSPFRANALPPKNGENHICFCADSGEQVNPPVSHRFSPSHTRFTSQRRPPTCKPRRQRIMQFY